MTQQSDPSYDDLDELRPGPAGHLLRRRHADPARRLSDHRGLTALFDDQFFVVAENYVFDLDPTLWGWIHLVLGIVMVAVGLGLMSGAGWARGAAVFLAMLSAILNFFVIPYYPFWSLLLIGLAVWVLFVDEARPRRGVTRQAWIDYRRGPMLLYLLLRWALIAIAFAITAWLLSGMEVSGGFWGYVWVSALFGIVNAVLGTLLRIITAPHAAHVRALRDPHQRAPARDHRRAHEQSHDRRVLVDGDLGGDHPRSRDGRARAAARPRRGGHRAARGCQPTVRPRRASSTSDTPPSCSSWTACASSPTRCSGRGSRICSGRRPSTRPRYGTSTSCSSHTCTTTTSTGARCAGSRRGQRSSSREARGGCCAGFRTSARSTSATRSRSET